MERREKLKESRKILAYPYCRPLGEPRRARGDALPGRGRSRAPRFVHFVRSGKLSSGSFLSAFMNADNPEVLRSGGSSGVAGISTFMSRTQMGQRDPGLPIPREPASLEAAVERRMEI